MDPSKCTCASGSMCAAQEAAYWAGCGQVWQTKGSDKFYCIDCCRLYKYEAKAAAKASNHFVKWKASMICKGIKRTCCLRNGDDGSPVSQVQYVTLSRNPSSSSQSPACQVDVVELQNRVEALEERLEARTWSEDSRIAEKVAEALAQHFQRHDGSNSSASLDAFNHVHCDDVDVQAMADACHARIDEMKQGGANLL